MKKRNLLSLISATALLMTVVLSGIGPAVTAKSVLPDGATIQEGDDTLVMKPGDVDWVIGSKGAYNNPSDGGDTYYTDYAKPWMENAWDGFAPQPANTYVYAYKPDVGAREGDYYWGGFMGRPIYSVYKTNAPWVHTGLTYKVQGGAYAALALVVGKNGDKGTSPEQLAKEYIFESSTDGSSWSPLTAAISLDFDGTDPVNTQSPKNPVMSVYKAVVQMPADATQLRVTFPGAVDAGGGSYEYPGKGYEGIGSVQIGTMVVSASDLTKYKNLNDVPEFKTPVLTPGTYDDLSEDFYYEKNIRSTWKDADNYNWNDAAGYAATFDFEKSSTAWDAEWTEPFGNFMGQKITTRVSSKAGWNGSALIYEVEEGSYVATALGYDPTPASNKKESCLEHFGFDVSADKTTWTPVAATIEQTSEPVAGQSYFPAYKAVVKIPEGMKYYRVTLPGFNRSATNGNEYTWSAGDRECEGGFFLGGSIASAYDLSTYDDLKDVPDSPFYVDKKADLKTALIYARAIELNKYKNDAEKTTFIDVLAEAEELLLNDEATIEEYNAMAAKLDAAREALHKKDVPDSATIKQEDERHILKPGVADWVDGSVFRDGSGNPITKTDAIHTWYACYTDYAKTGLIAQQDNLYLAPEGHIHATSYDLFVYPQISKLNFMGKPVEQVFMNTVSWAASNIVYKVYANSYVASAIIVNTADLKEDWKDIQNKYTFQVSANGTDWDTVQATITEEQTEEDMVLYKAVVAIPDGKYYYRVVMPGASSISPDTTWYASCPAYTDTYLGPTIASMTDLSKCDTYDELADKTAWYADAALTSKDTTKVQITDAYFKCIDKDLTIAQVLEVLNTETAGVAFYTADGTLITDTSTKLAAGMKADILDSKGISLSKALGLPLLTVASGNDLLAIAPIGDIEVDNGAPKTAAGLKLPATVKIEAGNGTFDATIEWDVDGCSYDPAVTQTQEFTVTGTVVLPADVSNGGNVSLEVTAKVTVKASTDFGVATTDETKVKIDEVEGMIYVRQGMTLQQINDILKPVGEVFIQFAGADGADIEDLNVQAEKGMTVDVYTDVVMIKSYEIAFLSDNGTTPGGDDSNGGETDNPKSGVATGVLPAVLLSAGAATAAVWFRKKRRV